MHSNGTPRYHKHNRILEYVVPDFVHIMIKGKIVKSGGKELAKEIEAEGYEHYK
jgi:Fe-S cluster assembly ATP-binding protein